MQPTFKGLAIGRLLTARVCSDTGERREYWHGGKKHRVAVAVCGAWVYLKNAAADPGVVTCKDCLDEMAGIVEWALSGEI